MRPRTFIFQTKSQLAHLTKIKFVVQANRTNGNYEQAKTENICFAIAISKNSGIKINTQNIPENPFDKFYKLRYISRSIRAEIFNIDRLFTYLHLHLLATETNLKFEDTKSFENSARSKSRGG